MEHEERTHGFAAVEEHFAVYDRGGDEIGKGRVSSGRLASPIWQRVRRV